MSPQIACFRGCKVTLVAFVFKCLLKSPVSEDAYSHWLHLCAFKLPSRDDSTSHWLHLFLFFSPLCAIQCVLKLPVWDDAKSHPLHLIDFSPLCIFKCAFKQLELYEVVFFSRWQRQIYFGKLPHSCQFFGGSSSSKIPEYEDVSSVINARKQSQKIATLRNMLKSAFVWAHKVVLAGPRRPVIGVVCSNMQPHSLVLAGVFHIFCHPSPCCKGPKFKFKWLNTAK